jgi:STE24 endopeptidase
MVFNLKSSNLNYKFLSGSIVLASYFFESYLDLRQYKKTRSTTALPKHLADIPELRVEPEEYRKNRAYNIDKQSFHLFRSTCSLFITLGLLYVNYMANLWELFFFSTESLLWALVLYLLVESVRGVLIDTPFSYYANFGIEEKHGFNKMTLHTFVTDIGKSFVISFILEFVFFGILVYLMEKLQEKFIIYAWVIIMILALVVLVIYPTAIAPWFNKFEPLGTGSEKEKILREKVEVLCKELGFPLGEVFKMDGSKRSDHSQAYFFGVLGKKKIVIYDTLLEKLEVEEITAVLGHELGHWKHKHNVQMICVSFLNIGLMLYLFSFFLNNDKMYFDHGFGQKHYFMGLNLFMMIYGPLGILIRAAICWLSRRNEYQADRFAISLGKGKELASGLIKLFKDNKANMDPDELYSLFHHTHPNLGERLAAIKFEVSKRA